MVSNIALDRQPSNLNQLTPIAFRLSLLKIPNVTYWIQSVSLPGLTANAVPFNTPFSTVQVPGDKLEYEPLTITFLVDEDLVAWQEIWDWMVEYTFPEAFTQYAGRTNTNANLRLDTGDLLSDGTLTMLTNNKNYNKQVVFKDMFPINLSALEFNSADTEVAAFVATVTFQYTTYRLESINAPAVPLGPE